MKKPKIALALGGGSARGLAHLGVLKVLEKHNIPIHIIAGTSIGAIVGSLYAKEKDTNKLEELAVITNNRRVISLLDFSFQSGLISGKKIMNYLKEELQGETFKDLKIPLIIVSTNLKTGEPVYFHKGNLLTAIRASISIPLVFSPVIYNKQILVDGQLSEPVPVSAALSQGADIVIAVNLDSEERMSKDIKPSFKEVANKTTKILLYQLSKSNSEKADVVISPGLDYRSSISFSEAKNFIKKGEQAAEKQIPKIKALIKNFKA